MPTKPSTWQAVLALSGSPGGHWYRAARPAQVGRYAEAAAPSAAGPALVGVEVDLPAEPASDVRRRTGRCPRSQCGPGWAQGRLEVELQGLVPALLVGVEVGWPGAGPVVY